MTIKFFKKKEKNPMSEEFVNKIKTALECYGVTDKKIQNECAHGMLQACIRMMKVIAAQGDVDAVIAKETKKMEEELTKAGITNKEVQQTVILMFFGVLAELAGVKNES